MNQYRILDIKSFMNTLLTTECFDTFLVSEIKVQGKYSAVIDGHIPEEIQKEEELEPLIPYGQVRTVCYDMMIGKRVPQKFRFVFVAEKQRKEQMLERLGEAGQRVGVRQLLINIFFHHGELYVTTGVNLEQFILDKTIEWEWENYVLELWKSLGIPWEKVS